MDWICYTKLHEIHKIVTVPPPQSSGIVPLNDPFKTSVPEKYGKPIFTTLSGLFYTKENIYRKYSNTT